MDGRCPNTGSPVGTCEKAAGDPAGAGVLSSVMREGAHTLADFVQACPLPKAALRCAPPLPQHHHSVTARVLVGDPFPLLMC